VVGVKQLERHRCCDELGEDFYKNALGGQFLSADARHLDDAQTRRAGGNVGLCVVDEYLAGYGNALQA
jgi:hypothetical protein